MSMKSGNGNPLTTGSLKRRRISASLHDEDSESDLCEIPAADWKPVKRKNPVKGKGLSRSKGSISPPSVRVAKGDASTSWTSGRTDELEASSAHKTDLLSFATHKQAAANSRLKASPIQLSTVNGLPASSNIDTVSLRDILGDPLIKECWLFNYLFDVDFIMYMLDAEFAETRY